MQVLEDRIPFRTGQLVDSGDRGLGIARAVARPARQQRRDQVGDRPADRLVDVELRGRVFLLLEVAHAHHQPRDAVGLVDGQDAVGELDRFVDVAIGERGDEGAVEQFVVLRIGAQRRAVERRSRQPRRARRWRGARRDSCRTVVRRLQIGLGRETAPALSAGWSGVCARTAAGAASATQNVSAATATRLKRRWKASRLAWLQD